MPNSITQISQKRYECSIALKYAQLSSKSRDTAGNRAQHLICVTVN